jgi:NitT/TauT family transport system substrate-binding protein
MGRFVVLVVLAVALAGCGGAESSAPADSQGVTTVSVATIPTAAAAPLFVGIDKGFFAAEHLRVKTAFAEGGAAIVPAVLKGERQFGFGNTISLFLAESRGIKLPIVAAGQVSPTDEAKDETALMVPKDSPIRDVKELQGKKIAVNTLQNIATLSIQAALDRAGVDPNSVKFLEVPFPEALAAINSGKVDAAFFGEPFTTLAKRDGARLMLRPFSAGVPGGQVGAYMTSEAYAGKNPDVVKRFARAVERSNRYVMAHPEAIRQSVPKFTEVPRDVAETMRLPVFVPTVDGTALQHLADLSKQYGVLKEPVDTGQMTIK